MNLAYTTVFTGLSGEAPLERLFRFRHELLSVPKPPKSVLCMQRNSATYASACVTIGETRGFAASSLTMAIRKRSNAKQKAEEILIPDKLYFRIGEVATLCHLPAYVLRFWESEFPQLKPVKSSTGQRMYRRRDVENVLRIKQLLYEQGFTISGARQQLRAETKSDKTQSAIPFPSNSAPEIQHIRQGLREILDLLSTRRTG